MVTCTKMYKSSSTKTKQNKAKSVQMMSLCYFIAELSAKVPLTFLKVEKPNVKISILLDFFLSFFFLFIYLLRHAELKNYTVYANVLQTKQLCYCTLPFSCLEPQVIYSWHTMPKTWPTNMQHILISILLWLHM